MRIARFRDYGEVDVVVEEGNDERVNGGGIGVKQQQVKMRRGTLKEKNAPGLEDTCLTFD